MKLKNLSLFFLFLITLLAISFTVSAIEDTSIGFAGGKSALLYPSSEHIVTDGTNYAVAYIGQNGNPNVINFQYSTNAGTSWTEIPMRFVTTETSQVSIARDSDFNIHAIYNEKSSVDGRFYLFYKMFDWNAKLWLPFQITEGTNITGASTFTSAFTDIKVDVLGNVHVVYGSQTSDLSTRELIYLRRNSSNTDFPFIFDLSKTIDSNVNNQIYAFPSMALDSNNNIYVVYSKNQDFPTNIHFDIWFSKSTSGGNTWDSPTQLVNKTSPQNSRFSKLIIDNSDILHFTTFENFTNQDDFKLRYYTSNDFGNTFSDGVNVSEENTQQSGGSLSIDLANVIYFTWSEIPDIDSDTSEFDIYAKTFSNGVFGDKIAMTTKANSQQAFLNLVFSNTYNQFNTILGGFTGIYEDRENANFDIRLLKTTELDFILGDFQISVLPFKPQYYWGDELDVRVTNNGVFNGDWRIVNATGIEVLAERNIAPLTSQVARFPIPNGAGVGIWSVQAKPEGSVWGSTSTVYSNFTVVSSGAKWSISASNSWIQLDFFVGGTYTAFAGEQYWVIMQESGLFTSEFGNYTTPVYADNQTIVIPNLFHCTRRGTFFLVLKSATNGSILATSITFTVDTGTPTNVFSFLVNDRYLFTERPTLKILCTGRDDYNYFVINANELIMTSGVVSNGVDFTFQLQMTASDVGTATILAYDVGDIPANGQSTTFEIVDRDADVILPKVDTDLGAIIGLIITVSMTLIPLVILASFKVDIEQIGLVSAVFGAMGIVVSIYLRFFDMWVIFFVMIVIIGVIIMQYIRGKS